VAEPTASPALSDYNTAHRVIVLVALFLMGFLYICSRWFCANSATESLPLSPRTRWELETNLAIDLVPAELESLASPLLCTGSTWLEDPTVEKSQKTFNLDEGSGRSMVEDHDSCIEVTQESGGMAAWNETMKERESWKDKGYGCGLWCYRTRFFLKKK
jgi:hypothetical protein